MWNLTQAFFKMTRNMAVTCHGCILNSVSYMEDTGSPVGTMKFPF